MYRLVDRLKRGFGVLAWLLPLLFDLLIAQAHPTEITGLRRLPFIRVSRLLGINAEHGFEAATGEFVERDLHGFASLHGLGEDIVRQLNLSSNHPASVTEYRMPSMW